MQVGTTDASSKETRAHHQDAFNLVFCSDSITSHSDREKPLLFLFRYYSFYQAKQANTREAENNVISRGNCFIS